MAKMVRFEIAQLPALRVVGKQVLVKVGDESPIEALWRCCGIDGSLDTLENMNRWHAASQLIDTQQAFVGWRGNWRARDVFCYVAGMLMLPDCPVPYGFDAVDIPACKIALSWVSGKGADVYGLEAAIISKINQAAHHPASWAMEAYVYSRFARTDAKGEPILDIYHAIEENHTLTREA